MYTTDQIREKFSSYFESKKHRRVESSSLVPAEDPTLLFVNAGMVQFKNVFLGLETRDYKRATTSQKCVRISGKHNDFEVVGRTPRHHTFFEMLGNFSFGDYFKKDAIMYAWDFITNELGLPKEKLWVSIFEEDDEAGNLWKEHTDIAADHIVKLGAADNFWSMGDIGPCGPCTEIHFDRGEEFSCGPECGLEHCECDRFMEIWNLVFMQYNRDEKGVLTPLPKPSVDTGMGLERIVSIMEGVNSNYDIDIFTPQLNQVSQLSGRPYDQGDSGFPFRVIADHARSASFLIADGVLPSNDGRGYVLRRILRRALRFGKGIGLNEPFLFKIVGTVVDTMGKTYPELEEKQAFIEKVVKIEEDRFLETLSDGLNIVASIIETMETEKRVIMSGEEAFNLYDTYGFPVELTEDILTEKNYTLDKEGFKDAMDKQKVLAKKNSKKNEFAKSVALANVLGKLETTIFVGDEALETTAKVLAICDLEGNLIDHIGVDEEAILVTDRTPFYGESGGQVGDLGYGYKEDVLIFNVNDTQKTQNGRIYQLIKSKKILENGDIVTLKVDVERRKAIMRSHSATHLLHRALQEVLGEHASQKGSYVDEHYLRFDFSHFELLSQEELVKIENLVNHYILSFSLVNIEVLSIAEAKKKGAMAIFGEKYGDQVRVVTMGDVSMEFCGGTHVANTGEIGAFKILSEGSVGSGLRRIEAITGKNVIKYMQQREQFLDDIKNKLKVPEKKIIVKIEGLQKELKDTQHSLQNLTMKLAESAASSVADNVTVINEIPVLIEKLEERSMDDLKMLADTYRDKIGSVLVVLGSKEGDKVHLLIAASKDLKDKVHCGQLIKSIAPIVDGSGGGRQDRAQAGGENIEKIEKALEKVKTLL